MNTNNTCNEVEVVSGLRSRSPSPPPSSSARVGCERCKQDVGVASEGGDGFGEAVVRERLQRGGEGGQRLVALSGGADGVPHLPDRRGRGGSWCCSWRWRLGGVTG
jgi:hypothetical protein